MKAAKTRAYNLKHAGTATHTAAAKARSLSLGEGVACCSAEALAASLRLAGGVVSDDDVLELHWLAGGDEDTGVSILAALEAAVEFGLAGFRPRYFEQGQKRASEYGRQSSRFLDVKAPLALLDLGDGLLLPVPEAECSHALGDDGLTDLEAPAFGADVAADDFLVNHNLTLGVELPGPHAVLAEAGRWWSWGKRYDPLTWPDAVIEEAWAVTW